ncbi:acetyltransferase [Bacillus sp. SB49]|nr:acetyltransferase [Bacillus sp. SB49]
MSFGKGFTTGYNCRFEMLVVNDSNPENLLEIGEGCKIGDNVHIAAGQKVIIGDKCLFASKIYISDISHGEYSSSNRNSDPSIPPDDRPLTTKPVTIGSNVWLGENVCVLPGVKIGNGCVIGANSVVNKNIPDNSIAVGVPAKVVKKYNYTTKEWQVPR